MVVGHGIKLWKEWCAVNGAQSQRAAMLQSYTPAAPDVTFSIALQCGSCLCVRV